MPDKNTIVTIDGPAAAGKTTVSQFLSRHLGFVCVDTGALYRGVAYEISLQLGVDVDWALKNSGPLAALIDDLDLSFAKSRRGTMTLRSHGLDISDRIRTPGITEIASKISKLPTIRSKLLGIQHDIASQEDAIFEGRDMGTVVFPEADQKFFLTADLEVRAKRRFDEQVDSGQSLDDVIRQMRQRDESDCSRKISPLVQAADAILIDSTNISVEGVIHLMLGYITGAKYLDSRVSKNNHGPDK